MGLAHSVRVLIRINLKLSFTDSNITTIENLQLRYVIRRYY